MIILGIADSHESHACVVKNGRLLSALAEERLSRLKADMGYPTQAVASALEIAGVHPREVDRVVFAGRAGSAFMRIYKRTALFEISDWLEQNHKYWKPKLYEAQPLTPLDDYQHHKHLRGDDLGSDPYFGFVERARQTRPEKWSQVMREVQQQAVTAQLGIPAERIFFLRHEDCHKAYGYHSAPARPERALVLTIEGGGDDSSATVSTVTRRVIDEHWKSNEVSLGRLYRNATLLLGMKPGQHEYKVMGLAPYGTEYYGRKSLEFFRRIDAVEGNAIVRKPGVKDLNFSLLMPFGTNVRRWMTLVSAPS